MLEFLVYLTVNRLKKTNSRNLTNAFRHTIEYPGTSSTNRSLMPQMKHYNFNSTSRSCSNINTVTFSRHAGIIMVVILAGMWGCASQPPAPALETEPTSTTVDSMIGRTTK